MCMMLLFSHLGNSSIPFSGRTQIEELKHQIQDKNTAVTDLEERLETLQTDEAIARSIQPDLALLETQVRDIQRLKIEIASQETRVSVSGEVPQWFVPEKEF